MTKFSKFMNTVKLKVKNINQQKILKIGIKNQKI